MDKKIIVKIPKENVNDEFYTLIELNVNSGDQIKKGTLIGVFETSKASFDIFAEMDGHVFFNVKINDNIPVGKPFCIITEDSKLESNDKALLQGSNSSSTTIKDKEKNVIIKCLRNFNPIRKEFILAFRYIGAFVNFKPGVRFDIIFTIWSWLPIIYAYF